MTGNLIKKLYCDVMFATSLVNFYERLGWILKAANEKSFGLMNSKSRDYFNVEGEKKLVVSKLIFLFPQLSNSFNIE